MRVARDLPAGELDGESLDGRGEPGMGATTAKQACDGLAWLRGDHDPRIPGSRIWNSSPLSVTVQVRRVPAELLARLSMRGGDVDLLGYITCSKMAVQSSASSERVSERNFSNSTVSHSAGVSSVRGSRSASFS